MSRDEIRMKLTEDENKKLKLLEEAATGPLTSKKPLIQKVSQILRSCYSEEDCNQYFKPISIAIGPLHHEKNPGKESRYKGGENSKLQLAATFIKHSGSTKEEFYSKVKEEIKNLRKCYDPKDLGEWNDEELVWIFLVDGCALLHFIFLDVKFEWKELGGKNDIAAFAKLDIFLLENQLPYQLLEKLIGLCSTSVPRGGGTAICQKALKDSIDIFINNSFLSPVVQQQHDIQVDRTHEKQQEEEKPAHLLELLRRRLVGVKPNERQRKKDGDLEKQVVPWCFSGGVSRLWRTARNVKELKAKGIRFKASEKRVGITKIEFNGSSWLPTLTLAAILVDDTTKRILLNLIPYEMCPDFDNDYEITSYASFLDSLIDNEEDVEELRDAGVLHSGLGSDKAVAELFNTISNNLVPNLQIYSEVNSQIQKHCDNKRYFSSIWATVQDKLTHTYFRTPWSIFVFIGAVAGLVMTVLQTCNSFKEHDTAPNFNYYYY